MLHGRKVYYTPVVVEISTTIRVNSTFTGGRMHFTMLIQ
jgi:hypothetical protein